MAGLAGNPPIGAVKDKTGVYSLGNDFYFASKEDVIVGALTPGGLENALKALDGGTSKLSRHFDTPNYWFLQIDPKWLEQMKNVPELGQVDLAKFFKAPLKVEYAASTTPRGWKLAAWVNVLESFFDKEMFDKIQPLKSEEIFLAGGGNTMFFSSWRSYLSDMWIQQMSTIPEFKKVLDQADEALKSAGLSMDTLKDLMTGSMQLFVGNEARVMGIDYPGGYLALTGQNGAASKVASAVLQSEQVMANLPLVKLEVPGWQIAYSLSEQVVPVTFFAGVKDEMLMVGLFDVTKMNTKPGVPADMQPLLDKPGYTNAYLDVLQIWDSIGKLIPQLPNLDELVREVGGMENLISIFSGKSTVKAVTAMQNSVDSIEMEVLTQSVPVKDRISYRVIRAAILSQQTREANYTSIYSDLADLESMAKSFLQSKPDFKMEPGKNYVLELIGEDDDEADSYAAFTLDQDGHHYVGLMFDPEYYGGEESVMAANAEALGLSGSKTLADGPGDALYKAGDLFIWMQVSK